MRHSQLLTHQHTHKYLKILQTGNAIQVVHTSPFLVLTETDFWLNTAGKAFLPIKLLLIKDGVRLKF